MRFYGVDMRGHLKLRQYEDVVPSYTPAEDGRAFIYVKDSVTGRDRIYIGGSEANQWVQLVTQYWDSDVDGGFGGFLTTVQGDSRYVMYNGIDTQLRDLSTWIDNVVFDIDGGGTYVPSGATLINIADNGTGVYDPSVGNNMGVKRDSIGDIFANIGHLTAVQAQYADLAEKYVCDMDLPVGTVVEVSSHDDYEVVMCMFELSSSVVGVVSEKPAYIMNKDSDGLPIALTGKIPVLVVGDINKGDFIVPAGNGHARKGEPSELMFKMGISLESNTNISEKVVTCIVK